MQSIAQLDALVRRAASRANPAAEFATASGLFRLLLDASNTADDLTDLIEALRHRREFVESDRLRVLQARLREAILPLSPVMVGPRALPGLQQHLRSGRAGR